MASLRTEEGIEVAANVTTASSFFSRAIGLLGRKNLANSQALLFKPGGSIHTLGMRFAIDVVFLDAEYQVLKLCPNVRPWRACRAPRQTRYTLELKHGRIDATRLQVGEKLVLRPSLFTTTLAGECRT